MRRGVLEHADTPEMRFLADKNKDIDWDDKMSKPDFENDEQEFGRPEQDDVKLWVQSEGFEAECKNLYAMRIQENLIKKKVFTLVECLEETMDLWSYGRDPFHTPVTNSYVPVRHTLMPKPDLSNKEQELGYRYNNFDDKSTTRDPINPIGRLSPL